MKKRVCIYLSEKTINRAKELLKLDINEENNFSRLISISINNLYNLQKRKGKIEEKDIIYEEEQATEDVSLNVEDQIIAFKEMRRKQREKDITI